MNISKEKQLRRLFRNFADHSMFNNAVVEKRKKLILVMRSFLHKKNMLDSCEVLEVTANFWQYFKDFYEENMSSSESGRCWLV
ncbi:Hypothetical predicted protein [Mytilus galloprovincialis]|uniref:Uncharacterized protein n=1 Tax=Mytilus galloprovincialis TaxID=29158 RepID=A0A8B6HL17_MYTGA|nr:Hypothetical predicted protein [Mytilus galloprovincialis]